jgi:hypothetical protein
MFPEFFNIDDVLHHEIVLPGQSIAARVLQRLRDAVWSELHGKRPYVLPLPGTF